MNTKSLIKLIKKNKRESPQPRSETHFISDENRWGRAVKTWVRDFQESTQRNSLPAFDSLFKDATR